MKTCSLTEARVYVPKPLFSLVLAPSWGSCSFPFMCLSLSISPQAPRQTDKESHLKPTSPLLIFLAASTAKWGYAVESSASTTPTSSTCVTPACLCRTSFSAVLYACPALSLPTTIRRGVFSWLAMVLLGRWRGGEGCAGRVKWLCGVLGGGLLMQADAVVRYARYVV